MKTYPFMNSPNAQTGKQRLEAKEWSEVRAELMQLKTKLNLSDDEFRMLSPYEDYQGIEEKIYQTFCTIDNGKKRPVWLWHCFKQEKYFTDFLPDAPECYLHKLIDPNESIWMGVFGMAKQQDKIWFYEGKILTIQKLLAELYFFDEFYFVSKKYQWLICINHHDTLIVTGGDMPQKLKALEQEMMNHST
ncbi:DUF6756 family protein [Psychrobacter sp. I-STPA10]|uniref:DUF6756 family protein n=1 Tax=Psychrobacter sp. I-STPA10 TaxID=2585769 RepID=UPI001E535807|nr:DUF6756 family protein [Psychrobacter sp. I-STPA10]